MIKDAFLILSDKQAVTTTAVSTNTIDLSATTPQRNLGGIALHLYTSVTETVTASGAATVVFALIQSDNADLSSADVLYQTAAIGKAALVAGAVPLLISLPYNITKRYIGVSYTVATGPLTAGKFDAFLCHEVPLNVAYKAGYSID